MSISRIRNSLFCSLLLAPIIFAQEGGGTLIGTVSDVSKAALPEVEIVVTNINTRLSRKSRSDEFGNYSFPALPVGSYDVTASRAGFATLRNTGVRVAVGSTTRLDLVLEIATTTQEVTVEARTELLRSDTAESGVLFDPAQVTSLPLNGRNFLQLVSLQPGVRNNSSASRQSFVINGAPPHQGINFLVDGTDATGVENAEIGGIVMSADRSTFALGLDSIQEFVVHASSFSVKYGRALGGVIETVTKSGTNEFHGNVFHFFRNSALNANSIQANAAGLPRAPLRFNQFGANAGGPIAPNRLFFWIGFEGLRRRTGRTNTYTVLSDAGRAAVIDPAIRHYVEQYIPRANRPPTSNPLLALLIRNDVTRIREDIGTARVDYHWEKGDNLFFRYNIHDTFATQPLLATPHNDNLRPSRQQLATLSWTHVFKPATTSNFRAGFNRAVTAMSNTGPNPRINLAGIFSPGHTYLFDYPQSMTGAADFTHIRGRHTLSWGFEYRTTVDNRIQDNGISFTFVGGAQQLNNFFRNLPDQIEQTDNIGGNSGESGNISLYLEDNLKVTRRLTLNTGLRWDYYIRPHERYGRVVGLAGPAFPISQITFKKPGEPLVPRDLRGYGPRFGFAYSATNKTVVRGGYGIFVGLNYPAMTTAATSTYVPPVIPRELFDPAYTRPIIFFLRSEVPNLTWPNADFLTREALLQKLPLPSPSFPAPDWRNTYTQQWSLHIERALPASTRLSVGYIGSKATKVISEDRFNLIRPFQNNTRENPNFGVITIRGSTSNANYHALQTTLSRRLASGMQFDVYYTWSHSIDDVFGFAGNNDPGVFGQTNSRRMQRGSSAFDIRHDFKANYSYDLPLGRSRLVKGWVLSGITRISAGAPFTVVTGSNVGDAVHPQRPNLTCSNPTTGESPGLFRQVLNRACFTTPTVRDPETGFFVGNLGRNTFTGASSVNFDMSITKNTAITDRLTYQLRVEFFNALNNTNFNAPIASTNNPNFGRILAAAPGRELQIAMKLIW